MTRIVVAGITALALAAGISTGARAQSLVDATDPGRLAELIRSAGFQATLGRSSSGAPMIQSAAEGVNFALFFYGCRENANCRAVQYFVSFRMSNPPSLEQINGFNETKVVGQAYLRTEDRQPRITYYITLDGGVTEQNFLNTFRVWRVLLRDFIAHIGFRS